MARTKTVKTVKAKRHRPELKTKEELEKYLDSHPETELPFLEELWETSVRLADKDRENGIKQFEITTTDNNGTTTEKKNERKFWSDNPVSWYFKQSSLPQWRRKSIAILEERVDMLDIKKQFLESTTMPTTYELSTDFESDELINWIDLFPPQERSHLKKRCAHYYDCYEINEGADKATLKRILSLEIALHRLDIKRAQGNFITTKDEKDLNEQLMKAFDSMKWTKKQRNARDDMAQNKFTVWISDVSKNEHFEPKKREYDKDEIDFLLDTYIDSAREMMS